MYDYSKLHGRIIEICGSQQEFAKRIGWSDTTLSKKLLNKTPWKQNQISDAISLLQISAKDIPDYFFKLEVRKCEQTT